MRVLGEMSPMVSCGFLSPFEMGLENARRRSRFRGGGSGLAERDGFTALRILGPVLPDTHRTASYRGGPLR